MARLHPVLFAVGALLAALAAAMLAPLLAALAAGTGDWRAFALSAGLALFAGGGLMLGFRTPDRTVTAHRAFVLTAASWVVLAAFAALPFALADPELSYGGAYFEAMSGLTTTGSTVLGGLDDRPPGILLWRALLQWLGGVGIVVMAVAVLPFLGGGGMQLFRTESSDRSDKALPRAARVAAAIGGIYAALTALWAAMLWLAGMGRFDAVCHAMTAIATGGFSTRDASIGHFDDAAIEAVVIAGMIAGSLPFALYLSALRGGPRALLADGQARRFLAAAAAAVAAMALWLMADRGAPAAEALRLAAFNAVSAMTGTGFATADYGRWGGLAAALAFFLMFVGGCTGGTTGGIKIFRFQVLAAAVRAEVARVLQPHRVYAPRYDRKPIPPEVLAAVVGFHFLFFAAFAAAALALALHGYDFTTSVSGAATAIANVGPGLGPAIGPSGNFAGLEDSAKWVLSAAMLLGRLELFTVLVLFLPRFWRA